ncbi:MAG: M56 family metallopeptidase [Marmoricola sp.]
MMDVAVSLPPILAVVLGLVGPALGRAMRPALTVRLLPIAGVVVALGTGFSLAIVAFYLLGHASEVAELGRWSVRAVPSPAGLPWPAGIAVAAGVAVLLLAAVRHAARAGYRLWLADGLCRRLAPNCDDPRTVVVDDERPDAYAVAGVRGRIVVSTAMLAALGREERAVLFAHESAHLTHRHYLWVQLAEIAAAANPMLRTLPAVVQRAAELWADEDAARAVGDRRLAARAIARAALASSRTPGDQNPVRSVTPGLTATGGDVPHRVQALLAPPRRRWAPAATAGLALLAITVLGASTITAHLTERTFEHAQAVDTHSVTARR